MNVSLFQAAAALDGNMRWQQMISDNLAAGSAPGFKKQDISFSSVMAGASQTGFNTANQVNFLLPSPGFHTNLTQGMLRPTQTQTDVAIEGPGFFSVELPNGETGYTRDGEFYLNNQGQLITKAGLPVLGTTGGPIQLNPRQTEPLTIDQDGSINQNGLFRGQLAMVEFEDAKQLRRIELGYFMATPELAPRPAENTTVRQGFLETGNVQPMQEMNHIILAMRHFEANQKVIQMTDDRMGRMIQELSATT
jgi:flagellar basal-body rod protein FlgF